MPEEPRGPRPPRRAAAGAGEAAAPRAPPASLWPPDLDLGRLPPLQCTIGYGSGVFRQRGYDYARRPMVDLVFVVRDAEVAEWHAENISRCPGHYASLLRVLGPSAIARVQRLGPGLYYNPHVELATRSGTAIEAKYGVITAEALLEDLEDWRWLYMAGRMHKPCLVEHHGGDPELERRIDAAAAANRRAALCAALLLSRPGPSLEMLSVLERIARLSYDGDIRVGIAENPSKVSNIVRAQQEDLCRMYLPVAADLGATVLPAAPGAGSEAGPEAAALAVDLGAAGRRRLFGELPAALRGRLEAAARGARAWEDPDVLRLALRGTVRRSSIAQTAKGTLTAGAARGARYALQKLGKRFGRA